MLYLSLSFTKQKVNKLGMCPLDIDDASTCIYHILVDKRDITEDELKRQYPSFYLI